MTEQKRKSLEIFIREQTMGPGAIGKRFADLAEQSTTFENSYGFSSEILNIVPGGIYSTGILFPVDDTKGEMLSNEHSVNDNGSDTGQKDEENEEDEEGNESDNEEDEVILDQQSLNQMYPNTMGMTVCLDQKILKDNDLDLVVSGRYYTKVDLKHENRRIAVLLEQNVEVFRSILQSLPASDVICTSVRVETDNAGNHYVSYVGDITIVKPVKDRVYSLKREYLDRFKHGEKGNYRSLDTLKGGLFDELKRRVIPTSAEGKRIIEKLKQIEQIESALAHILDLINIYDARGYGLWKCKTFELQVFSFLSDVDISKPKQAFTYKNRKELADIYKVEYVKGRWASLSVNLQYSKGVDKASERLFMKVQLANTSKHFDKDDTKDGRNFFSMASEEVNKRCFFGVGIRANSKYLLPYRDISLKGSEQFGEEDINRYIYRQYKDYGVGHGCSVKWSCNNDLYTISTEYIPACETPDIDPTPRYKGVFESNGIDGSLTPKPIFQDAVFFRFKWLSTLSDARDEDVIVGLLQFVDAYGEWIERQRDGNNPNIVIQIRENCKKDEARVRKNIQHLSANKEHLRSFRLMNTAMFMQLWHSVKKESVHGYMNDKGFEGFFEPFYREYADDRLFSGTEHAAWRPFQLAFILLNIDGIFQREDDSQWLARNEWVDLVWFPTGGGKTEAYLGLIALAILHRRISYGANGGGTAVIMRYTLRLLTAQQFQRATFLIMALELIRRWGMYRLGNEPIYIGLYVGQGSLPNKLRGDQDSLLSEYKALEKAQKDGKLVRTKIQLRKCPCCGQPLVPIKYSDVNDPDDTFNHGRILLCCSDTSKKCAFYYTYPFDPSRKDQGPIPVSMCDEEIYQHPPALLFGTVDKFAQIAHKISNKEDKRNADSRRLFGKGNWEKGKPKNGYLPPDMIIQDELHLMMGPLGSAVALFESAIDQLCTRQENGITIRPKVISSTATTRNTDLQIMALFDRKVNLFPKPGIDCDDSFFAFYKRQAETANEKVTRYLSKRRYIGILPTGRTQMWMQLRLAAILFTHRAVFETHQLGAGYPTDSTQYSDALTKAVDYYHTVLAYFNSLREVGKTESQIFTYLVKEIRRVFNKVLRPDKLMHCFYTFTSCFHTGELTGRLSGEEVVEQMAKIGVGWLSTTRLANGNENEPNKGRTPPDFVIATNMISVGIDISRFNSMIINCMPRNIAEYIQASSRVARDKEGLVITVHHPFRSRDISHYEKFIEFHEKMYSYVEPISITPFTRKALERYLPLYIATILRHTIPRYVEREDANISLSNDEKSSLADILLKYFKERGRLMQHDPYIKNVIKELLTDDNLKNIDALIKQAIDEWQKERATTVDAGFDMVFNNKATNVKNARPQRQLYVDMDEYSDNIHSDLWRIPQSLRVVDPEAVIHIEPK